MACLWDNQKSNEEVDIFQFANDLKSAKEYLKSAYELDTSDMIILINLAKVSKDLGEKDEAIKILDSISCERKSNEALIIQAHKFFTADSDKERKSAAAKFKKSVSHGLDFLTDFSQKLLEVTK